MKHWLTIGLAGLMTLTVGARAEEAFSKAIRPEDFAAAELGKLSPEALAKLDELVQAYKSGAVAAARAEAEAQAAKAAAAVAAQEKEKEKQKAASPGFFAKAKVFLTPGTEVEYNAIESRIAGNFKGWGPHTVLVLENGQRWKVVNDDEYNTRAVDSPKVLVYPASFSGFWLELEGTSVRVRVTPVVGR